MDRSRCLTHATFANIPRLPLNGASSAASAPSLQSLTLKSVYVIPDHLTSPPLRELVVVSTEVPFPSLAPLIARSSCSLEQLELSGAAIQWNELFQCLSVDTVHCCAFSFISELR
jgi:hypothetical protein